MNHLSGMDASFLHLESPEMPMHVGSLQLFSPPPGTDALDLRALWESTADADLFLVLRVFSADAVSLSMPTTVLLPVKPLASWFS